MIFRYCYTNNTIVLARLGEKLVIKFLSWDDVTGGCSIVLLLIAAKSASEHRKRSWEGEEGEESARSQWLLSLHSLWQRQVHSQSGMKCLVTKLKIISFSLDQKVFYESPPSFASTVLCGFLVWMLCFFQYFRSLCFVIRMV